MIVIMSSILTTNPIELNIQAVRKGLSWAQSWTSEPVLCRIKDEKMHLIAVSQQRFLVSWAWPLPGVTGSQFFLIPPFVISTITNPAAYSADALAVMLKKNVAGLIIKQGKQEFRLQWRWTPDSFKAPKHFEQMLNPPQKMIQDGYLALADVVHLAIANLGHISAAEDVSFEEAVIEMNLPLTDSENNNRSRYFFEPRLVIRGMEVTRGDRVGFAMQPIENKRAILHFTTQREDYFIHCAILSTATKSAWAPSTTITIRETRPPMSDGAWISPRRS